jgi:hypothetical protein
MWKLVIPALAVALTGCGGGSGSGTVTSQVVDGIAITAGFISTPATFIPSLVPGNFSADGSKYVVLSGWYIGDTTAPPIKVYRLSNGTASDATVDILGGNHSVSVNYPVVADFNRDGVDDIFFAGFTDIPGVQNNPSYAFISRPGQSHQRVNVPGSTWSHGSVAADVNNDGFIDVINSQGHIWTNDGTGQFAFNTRKDWQQGYQDYVNGSGVCAGDFDRSGTTQIVVTDMSLNGTAPIQDTYIFKLDNTLAPTRMAVLPMPWFDVGNTTATELSHDVSCTVGDLNNDGWQDIIVVSAKQNVTTTPESRVQIYLNRGNWQFDDATSSAMSGWSTAVLSSYTPQLFDYNNDGRLDLWLMDWDNWGRNSNQLWLNSVTTSFAQTKQTDLNRLLTNFQTATGAPSNALGIMIPVKVNGAWNFAYTSAVNNKVYVGYANTQWSLQ